jgi:hypothetical protein
LEHASGGVPAAETAARALILKITKWTNDRIHTDR